MIGLNASSCTSGANPIKILFVATWGKRIYGGERWIVNLCQYMDASHFMPVVALHAVGELHDTLTGLGVQVHQQKLDWLRARPRSALLPSSVGVVNATLGLSRLIRRTGARLIHVFDGEALESAYLASLLCRVPMVTTIQLIVQFPRLESLILARIARVVAVSQACYKQFLAIGVPEQNIAYISTGVDPARFLHGNGSSVREEFNIPEEAPIVGIVASLEPNKAQDIFLQAAALVHQQFPTARFLLVGHDKTAQEGQKGLYHRSLENLAIELGLTNSVIFAGFRRDIPDILAALDIAVLCSDQEGLGLSIIEAMASAKPVVATAVGGVVELVRDGSSGILVPPRNPAALSEAVGTLLADPVLARRMGEQGRQIAQSRFSVKSAVQQNEALYDDVLAEWGRGE